MTSSEKPSQIAELLLDKLSADEPDWIDEGACTVAGVDPFDSKNTAIMLELCRTCPVLPECKKYRDEKNVSNGVWGGASLNDEGVNN